jgi:uncharacterized protein (TIGR04255 family)
MSDLFPNAPLVNAIFQVRFAGETAIETARPSFQEAVRSELPKLYVSKAEVGVAPALQPYTFRNDAETESVDLALNAFSYSTSAYPGFAEFKNRFQRFFTEVSSRVVIHKLTRIGLRYINHIPVLRAAADERIPIEDYLNVGFSLPGALGGANLVGLNGVFQLKFEGGTLRMQLEHKGLNTPSRDEVIVLDFDYSQQDALSVAGLDQHLELAHTQTKAIFLSMISPKYLTVLKGDGSAR